MITIGVLMERPKPAPPLKARSACMTLLPRLGLMMIALFWAPGLSAGESSAAGTDAVNIYAARSVAEAVRAAIAGYQAGSGRKVVLTSGRSAEFVKQIEDGAPASIFVSASRQLVTGLIARGFINQNAVASPVGNSLVLTAPANSPFNEVTISPDTDFVSMLGAEGSIAVADPDYTPLGIYTWRSCLSLANGVP